MSYNSLDIDVLELNLAIKLMPLKSNWPEETNIFKQSSNITQKATWSRKYCNKGVQTYLVKEYDL